ncbi:MAG: sigma-70 family RNA polymerase sigma factor [Bacteroidales bacterium]|nr:sigma-70 family RNA polymerase sigma factor [Bacteroidales bacterium]
MDKEITQLLRRNNRKAQRILYDKYAKRMFLLGLRYVNSEYEVVSIVNAAFYKVYSNIRQFDWKHEHSLEGWIKKIVVNEALQYIRANKKITWIDIETQYDLSSFEMPDDQLNAADYLRLINALPDGYRLVFNLYAIEGFSHKEIADKLDITESTSRSQLTHARRLLKKKILELL